MPKKSKAARKEMRPWVSANQNCIEKCFAMMGQSLFLSPRFQKLSYSARSLYACLVLECRGYRDFKFPQAKMIQYGFPPRTARRAIAELIKAGFIEKTLSGKNLRKPNHYSFSLRWRGVSQKR